MPIDFVESGQGPALLFLPGSYSNHGAWRAIQKALRRPYRLISTSLPGYGGTEEFRDATVRGMSGMSDFVARVVDRVGEPVHLIGHSYGGLTLFASVLSKKVSPLSLITFEGNPIFPRRVASPFVWTAAVNDMVARFKAAVEADDPGAAAIIIDFWGGPDTFAAMPDAFRDFCRASAFTNLLDWQSAMGFTPSGEEYAAISVPATIARGEFANPAMVDISDEIVRSAPKATLKVVPGSGHFLISTHPSECAAIIDAHMEGYLTA